MNRAEALAIRKERVKKARQFADFTQEELAEAITAMTGTKVTRQAIIDVEKGRIDLETYQIEAIAEICGVEFGFLTGKADTLQLRRAKGVYVSSALSMAAA